MGIFEKFLSRLLQTADVVYKGELSKSAYHIRIQSEKIRTAQFVPGYFLRVAVGMGKDEIGFSDKVRSYSVWNIDTSKGIIDLAIATHSEGSGTKWAEDCEVGSAVHFGWHKGKFLVDDSADSYIMIGDLSALAHLYQIYRNLPKEKIVRGIFYSHHIGEMFADIDGSKPFSFHQWGENPVDEVIKEIDSILPGLSGKKKVYIAGDSRLCVALNKHFKNNLKWTSGQIKVKPFWNPIKKGLE